MLRDSQECSMEWIVLLTMLESTFRFILDLQDNDISYNIWDEAICSYRGTEMVPKPPTWVNLLQVLLLLPNNSQLLFHMLKLLVCGLDLLLQGGGVRKTGQLARERHVTLSSNSRIPYSMLVKVYSRETLSIYLIHSCDKSIM